MIYGEQIETRPMGDARVLDYLEAQNYHKCLDIGGVQRPWASRFVTTYVDLVKPEDWEKRYPGMYKPYPEIWKSWLIQGDCESDAVRSLILGEKYDFVVCSHMLEHLTSPKRFLEFLPLVANEGYIAIPNKIFELGRGREQRIESSIIGCYRGAFPHRWIFTIKEKVLWGFPKLSAVETMDFGPLEKELKHNEPLEWGQLGFFWEGDIPVRIINDLDIGSPNPQRAIEFYRKELNEGL